MTTIDRDAYRDQYAAMGGMFDDSAQAASASGAAGQPAASDTAPPEGDTSPPQHDGAGAGAGTPSTGSSEPPQASGGDGGSETGGGGTSISPGLPGLPGVPGLGDILGEGSGLTLAGSDGILQPVLNAANTEIKGLDTNVLDTLGHQAGLGSVVHGVTDTAETIGLGEIGAATPAGDGHTNLITDLLNAPGTLLGGGGLGTVLTEVGSDLNDIVHSVDGVVGSLTGDTGLVGSLLGDTGLGSLFGGTGTTNPVTGVVQTVDGVVGSLLGDTGVGSLPGGTDVLSPATGLLGNVLHDVEKLPLLSINGGNNANDGGLLGGLLGNLGGSNTGHLADVDVGPEQPNGNAINLLAAPTSGDHHTVEVNAVDVGQSGPHLLDIGALTGTSGLSIPSLGGTGADGLAGNLLGSLDLGHALGGNIASGNTASAPVSAPVDISNVLHDLVSGPLAADHGILDSHGTHLL